MPVYLLDTNVISDLMAEHPRAKSRLRTTTGHIVTSVIVCGEVRYGLERIPAGKRRDNLRAKANNVLRALTCENVTEPIADIYADLRADSETKGLALDDNDLWIAATALALNAILVSRDADFARTGRIHVEDSSQQAIR